MQRGTELIFVCTKTALVEEMAAFVVFLFFSLKIEKCKFLHWLSNCLCPAATRHAHNLKLYTPTKVSGFHKSWVCTQQQPLFGFTKAIAINTKVTYIVLQNYKWHAHPLHMHTQNLHMQKRKGGFSAKMRGGMQLEKALTQNHKVNIAQHPTILQCHKIQLPTTLVTKASTKVTPLD